jgi:hypothetical protein
MSGSLTGSSLPNLGQNSGGQGGASIGMGLGQTPVPGLAGQLPGGPQPAATAKIGLPQGGANTIGQSAAPVAQPGAPNLPWHGQQPGAGLGPVGRQNLAAFWQRMAQQPGGMPGQGQQPPLGWTGGMGQDQPFQGLPGSIPSPQQPGAVTAVGAPQQPAGSLPQQPFTPAQLAMIQQMLQAHTAAAGGAGIAGIAGGPSAAATGPTTPPGTGPATAALVSALPAR